jgi:hypothetical protein
MASVSWINQVLFCRFGLIVTGSCAATLAACLGFGASNAGIPGPKIERSPSELKLISELELLRGTWNPRQRVRIIERAAGFADKFAGPMSRILRLDDHDLIEEAVEYAGAMGVVALRPDLVALACSKGSLQPSARIRAVLAAECLGPWSQEQLSHFLTAGSLPLRLASLQVCAKRPDAPWMQILPILSAGYHEGLEGMSDDDLRLLRDAAILAVPKKLDQHVLRELWSSVMVGDTRVAAAALSALARTEPNDRLVKRLLAHLDQLEGNAVIAGLDLLSKWGLRLANPAAVWTLVERNDLDSETCVFALSCLELTKSFRPTALVDALPSLPPLAQHFAARCMLTMGHADGFRWLLDVAESGDARAVTMSRQLLAWLTGKTPNSDREEFEAAMFQAIASLRGRKLPAHGMSRVAGSSER